MYLATRYSNCKGKPKGVCGEARSTKRKLHGTASFVLKTRAPGDGHHYGLAGILQRPLNLSPGGYDGCIAFENRTADVRDH
nr:MAG TPA: hypothetical protein [Caudoviricetes sp.]